jgi:hypothetical protein
MGLTVSQRRAVTEARYRRADRAGKGVILDELRGWHRSHARKALGQALRPSHNGSIGQQIEAYWKKQGFAINTSGGFANKVPVVTGETKDSFTISLATGKNGLMSLSASSPCIYPDGTPRS